MSRPRWTIWGMMSTIALVAVLLGVFRSVFLTITLFGMVTILILIGFAYGVIRLGTCTPPELPDDEIL